MAWNTNGTTPVLLGHTEWLRLRKQAEANGTLPGLGWLLWHWHQVYLLGSYIQSEAAALVDCTTFDLSVLEAAGEEGRADFAAGRVTMEQLRLRYRLRNGGGDRALEEMGPQRVLHYLDNLTAPAPR